LFTNPTRRRYMDGVKDLTGVATSVTSGPVELESKA
jgi:hypothetical protein